MTVTTSIAISARKSSGPVTPEQERFRFLLAEIEKARKARSQLDALLLGYRQEHTQRIHPLRATLTKVCRDSVFALDGLLDQKGWTRLDRAALQDLLCGNAEMLLEAIGPDAEIRALFEKHSGIDLERARKEELQDLIEQAAEMTGVDLSNDESIRTEDDLIARMSEEMAARREAEEFERANSRQSRKKSAAQKRAEDAVALAKQSLRDIYRKLASAVHPDREADAERREEKNKLMQRINQAYANNDLLTLFEAQLELQQIDGTQLDLAGTERLKQYNKLLSEQLIQLRNTTRELELDFCQDHGLRGETGLTKEKLKRAVQSQARAMRGEITRQQKFLDLLADKAAVKRWLKMQRGVAREFERLDEDE